MKKRFLFAKRMKKMFTLLALFALFCGAAQGQSTFWSVFGVQGCSNSNQMSCAVAPAASSFTGIADLDDHSYGSGALKDNFKNSVYSGTGLLFSVNADGIYAPDGTMIMDFDPSLSSVAVGSYTVFPGYAVSEINIFPMPGHDKSYYVVFWAKDETPHQYELRVVRVDINASFPDHTTGFTCTDGAMLDAATGPYVIGPYWSFDEAPFHFVLATDAPNSDCTRDLYTLDPLYDGSHLSKMRRWTIAANGDLPTSPYTYYDHRTTFQHQTNAYNAKGKILNIGGVKFFSYISGDQDIPGASKYGYYLNMYTLNDATSIVATTAGFFPALSASTTQQIYGFDYIPSKNAIYFSYSNFSATSGTPILGGLGYWTATGGIVYSSNSTTDYSYTDLELDSHEDLFMVNGTDPTVDGKLAYLPAGSTMSSVITPTVITTGCTYNNISVSNNIFNGTVVTGNSSDCYYLGSQIRGELYNIWGGGAAYTVSGTEVWTPTSNPTGATATTINMSDIAILPGASLTIQNMTVTMTPNSHIDVYASTSTAVAGGHLTLTGATLTHYLGNCVSSAGGLWGGVRVWGNPAFSQFLSPYTSPQGLLTSQGSTTIPSSTIAYAKQGVLVGQLKAMPMYYAMMIGGGPVIPFPCGGGIIMAEHTTFYNNNVGVQFYPYRNISPSTGSEMNNRSYLQFCTFNSDDITTVTGAGCTGTLIDIMGADVKGIKIQASDFTNNIGYSVPSYGIYGSNMGFNLVGYKTSIVTGSFTSSHFSKFYMGVADYCTTSSNTPAISNAIFTDNIIGVNLDGCQAPLVTQNTFNVPSMSISSYPSYYYYSIGAYNTIGLLLKSADLYSVYNNTFTGSSPNTNVGVLAWNTGGGENLVNNNTYDNLACGNLGNYNNFDGLITGLWFRCNSNNNVVFDISARGANPTIDGIRNTQGIQVGGPYPATKGATRFTVYPYGLPSGDVFSSGSGGAYNLHFPLGQVSPIYYNYNSMSGTSPLELPGVTGVTEADFGGVTLVPIAQPDACPVYSLGIGGVGSTSTSSTMTHTGPMPPYPGPMPIPVTETTGGIEATMDIKLNINYYMSDSVGIPHRDSLYYWFGQLHSASGDRAIAYMLLEDGFADSATTMYDNIIAVDSLHGDDSTEYACAGKKLFEVQRKVTGYYAGVYGAIKYANANGLNADSVILADSALWNRPILDTAAKDSLISIFHSSHSWARNSAENILFAYAPDTISAMLTVMPDTLLFPEMPIDTAGTGLGKTGNNDDKKPTARATIQNSIYPNPVNNTLQVVYQPMGTDVITIRIDDIAGRHMIDQVLQGGINTIDVHNLLPGTYLYSVYEGKTPTMKGKVVKD